MLPQPLVTNEVKNSAGTEQEFSVHDASGRALVYRLAAEVPSQPHRITVSHLDSGSGLSARRRSLVRVDLTIPGQVDTTKLVKISCYAVADIPVGQLTALTTVTNVMANLISFLASRGASTTILYDGTGCGAEALINGSL